MIPFVDLIKDSAAASSAPPPPLGPFETKFGAFIYDKGYRQLFRALGYPGLDAEAEMALTRLNAAATGGVCLDVSCGPGMISSKLATGGAFATFIASDYSEAMTLRAAEQVAAAAAAASTKQQRLPALAAVRADVGALPFADACIDAVHCSAGMHCWPSPAKGLAEVARVLKPGALFIMSTVVLAGPIRDKYMTDGTAGDSAEYVARGKRTQNTPFWDDEAVAALLREAGLVEVEVVLQDKCFVMLTGRKPKGIRRFF